MAKILITGGAGFIGYHLARKLSQHPENRITLADNLHRSRMDEPFQALLESPNVTFVQVDLTDWESMQPIRSHFDEVYHLAAIIGVKHCLRDPNRVLRTNILSTMNVVELMKKHHCDKLIFSSSSEVYGSGFELGIAPVPTDETVPVSIKDITNPRYAYAVSKIAGEQLVIVNAPGNYRFSVIRFHNIYGPRMGYAHVIPEVIRRIYEKENPFHIYGYDNTRAFCYVDDAIEQLIAVMRSEETDGEIVHLGNDREEILIEDLIRKIMALLDYQVETIPVKDDRNFVKRRCPDLSKLKQLTGVVPQISIDEGLKRTVEWYWKELQKNGAWE